MTTRALEHFWRGTGILTSISTLPLDGYALTIAGGSDSRGNGVIVNPASNAGVRVDAVATEGATVLNEEFSLMRQGIASVVADSSVAVSIGDEITAGVGAGLFKPALEGEHVCGVAMSAAAGAGAGETFLLFFFGGGGGYSKEPAGVNYEILTANKTLTAADVGKTFILNAVDLVVTLPAVVIGYNFRFIVNAPSGGTGFSISPNASDKINGGTDDKDLINSGATDAIGNAAEVWGVDAAGWMAATTGTWAAEA